MSRMRLPLVLLPALLLPSCFLFQSTDAKVDHAALTKRSHQAETAMSEQDWETAVQLFDEVLSADPENVPAWIGLGDAYGEMGEWDRAEPAFAQACTRAPESYEAQFGHGLSLQMLDRLVEAVAAYHRAMTIDPLSSEASLGIATSYMELDEPQHALPFARRAVELAPDDGRAWLSLGAAEEQSGHDKEALEAYLAASERIELAPELMHNLLYAYARARRYHEVIGTARSMIDSGILPSAEAWERMAWAYFRLGQYDESAEAYREAVDTSPQMWQAWNGLGVNAVNRWLLSERQDAAAQEEAVVAFARSLQIKPDQPKVAQLVNQYGLQ